MNNRPKLDGNSVFAGVIVGTLSTGLAISAATLASSVLAPPHYRIVGLQETATGINYIIDEPASDKRFVLTDNFSDGLILPSESYKSDSDAILFESFDSATVTLGIDNPNGSMGVRNLTPAERKDIWGFVMGKGYRRLQTLQSGLLGGDYFKPVDTSILKMDF
jgi:hypothetical protein